MVDRTTRPIVPTEHSDEREHRRLLAMRASAALPKDGTEGMTAPLRLMSYATAALPDASLFPDSVAYDTDLEAVVISDGAAWIEVAAPPLTYAAGTWTPVLQFGGASTGITYSVQAGSYVRVGALVQAWARIALTSKGSATGLAQFAGLPYTASSLVASARFTGSLGRFINMDFFAVSVPHCGVSPGGSAIRLFDSNGASDNTSEITDAFFTNTSDLTVSISYMAA